MQSSPAVRPVRRSVWRRVLGVFAAERNGQVAGYLADSDLVFVLDVNETFKPWLVKSRRLFDAMDSVDSSTGKKRGLLIVH